MRGFFSPNLELILCSRDGGVLRSVSPQHSEWILDGQVQCVTCKRIYHIHGGILDLLEVDVPANEDNRHELELREGDHKLLRGAPGSSLSWRDTAEIESTIARLGDPSGMTVLELGCGPGVYTRRLASARRLLAVDFSLTSLRRNLAQLPDKTTVGLVRADVGSLLLAPKAFDVALATLYSNLPSPALRHACNHAVAVALRPAGRYLVCAHHQDLRRILKGLPDAGYYSSGGIFFQCFTRQTLRAELSAFEIESIEPICIELPGVSRVPSDPLRTWIARQAARVPAINQFGSLLLASVRNSAV